MYNTKLIEITSGLHDGDHVLLAPPFDADEKDLGGAILADGEALPGLTNQINAPHSRTRENNGRRLDERLRRGLNGSSGTRPVPGGTGSGPALGSAPAGASRGGERQDRRGEPPGETGASRSNRLDLVKQFDANGDGQLDETEKAAMRERFARERNRNPPPAGPGAK
jgi:hypothetical protein